ARPCWRAPHAEASAPPTARLRWHSRGGGLGDPVGQLDDPVTAVAEPNLAGQRRLTSGGDDQSPGRETAPGYPPRNPPPLNRRPGADGVTAAARLSLPVC